MKAVVLHSYSRRIPLSVETIPVPRLQRGQVLVRMAASPINPSDLIFLRNLYGIQKTPPVVPGFEGSGTVVASRGGLYGRWLVGRAVTCRAPSKGDGTWAEYMAVDTQGCMPLRSGITFEEGASFMINPLSAWALLEIAREGGVKAVVQTAAASALGRMIHRLARRQKIACINIVRRPEQVELLSREGARPVLDSSQPGFATALSEACRKHHASLGFDAVGGELTGQVLGALKPGGHVLVYGVLSGESCEINAKHFVFEDKAVEGFWLVPWIMKRSLLERIRMARAAQARLKDDLRTDIQGRFPLEKIAEAIALYKEKRTEGKVLLIP